MTEQCPHPAKTVTGVLTLALDDAQLLIERMKSSGDEPVFGNPNPGHPKRKRPWRAPMLRTSVMRGTLARVPLDAHPRARRAPAWRAVLTCAEALEEGLWEKAWRALYGAGTGPGAWRKAAHEFAAHIARTLKRATPGPNPSVETVQSFSDWVDWAGHTLHGAVERAEHDTHEAAMCNEARPGAYAADAPATLTETLEVAIADGRSLLVSGADGAARYHFNSTLWHHRLDAHGETCAVCAAGAVMVGRLDAAGGHDVTPASFAPAWTTALIAIEDMRLGAWEQAFNAMHGLPEHPGAAHFATHAPEHTGDEGWETSEEFAQWLDLAEHERLPGIRAAETQALEVR